MNMSLIKGSGQRRSLCLGRTPPAGRTRLRRSHSVIRTRPMIPPVHAHPGRQTTSIVVERIMSERQFAPDEPGWRDLAPQHCGGTPEINKRRRADPPATLNQHIEQAFDGGDDTGESLQRQAYPISSVEQGYGLFRNYAAVVTAEFRREDA
jgi:hypothetical protein